jgi:hypothetical protein
VVASKEASRTKSVFMGYPSRTIPEGFSCKPPSRAPVHATDPD